MEEISLKCFEWFNVKKSFVELRETSTKRTVCLRKFVYHGHAFSLIYFIELKTTGGLLTTKFNNICTTRNRFSLVIESVSYNYLSKMDIDIT